MYVLTCIRTCCSNCVCLFPAAPPSYAEVVTEEQRQSSLAPLGACDDFERALPGPLFAYIQEFRFLPPPLYSEVGTSKLWMYCRKLSFSKVQVHCIRSFPGFFTTLMLHRDSEIVLHPLGNLLKSCCIMYVIHDVSEYQHFESEGAQQMFFTPSF